MFKDRTWLGVLVVAVVVIIGAFWFIGKQESEYDKWHEEQETEPYEATYPDEEVVPTDSVQAPEEPCIGCEAAEIPQGPSKKTFILNSVENTEENPMDVFCGSGYITDCKTYGVKAEVWCISMGVK